MSAAALLASLENKGVRMSANGGRLVLEAKPGVLTPELRAKLVENKPALVALLSEHSRGVHDERQAIALESGVSPELAELVVLDAALAEPTPGPPPPDGHLVYPDDEQAELDNVAAVVARLRLAGVALTPLDGGVLHVESPPGWYTDERRTWLARHAAALATVSTPAT